MLLYVYLRPLLHGERVSDIKTRASFFKDILTAAIVVMAVYCNIAGQVNVCVLANRVCREICVCGGERYRAIGRGRRLRELPAVVL